jgi:hypothetical protein
MYIVSPAPPRTARLDGLGDSFNLVRTRFSSDERNDDRRNNDQSIQQSPDARIHDH